MLQMLQTNFRAKPALGFDGIVHSTVNVLDVPTRLVVPWKGGGIGTMVSFDLEDAGHATRLRLADSGVRRRMIWNRRPDFGAERAGSSV